MLGRLAIPSRHQIAVPDLLEQFGRQRLTSRGFDRLCQRATSDPRLTDYVVCFSCLFETNVS
jgi:hypothetical protein